MVLVARCFFQHKHGGRKAYAGDGPQESAREAADLLRTVQESMLIDRASAVTREELSAALRQLSL